MKSAENSEKRKAELMKNAQELLDYRKAMVETDFASYEQVQKHLTKTRLEELQRRRDERSAKRKALAEQNDQ